MMIRFAGSAAEVFAKFREIEVIRSPMREHVPPPPDA